MNTTNIKDYAFWRAAEYATDLGYKPGSGEWWKTLRHGLRVLAGTATYEDES